MNWSLFNPFQKFFCIASILLLLSQGFLIYKQHSKNHINLSCPEIPEIPAFPEPQKIDMTGIKRIGLKLDVVIKHNKKLDLILREQKKIDKILKKMDSWGIDR